MKFWRSRKQVRKSQHAGLSIEKLESRELMAVIPIVSGQTATFQDADGTQVNVKLVGPGQGSIELTNGQITGAGIDSLQLTGTSAASKLKISTRGGSVSGTTINELVITKALNELGALKNLKAKGSRFHRRRSFHLRRQHQRRPVPQPRRQCRARRRRRRKPAESRHARVKRLGRSIRNAPRVRRSAPE